MGGFKDYVFTLIVFVCVLFIVRVLLSVIWRATWTPENNPKWGEYGRSLCVIALFVFIINLGLRFFGVPSYSFFGIFPLPHFVGILVLFAAFYIPSSGLRKRPV